MAKMELTYLIPHIFAMVVLTLTLRFKNSALKKERQHREISFENSNLDQELQAKVLKQEAVLNQRHFITEILINAQFAGVYIAAFCFSAGVLYAEESTGVYLFPSIGVFCLFANILFVVEEQAFRLYKKRQLKKYLAVDRGVKIIENHGARRYYVYLALLILEGFINLGLFYAMAVWLY
ncbi:hypothetical protein KTT66_07980 [Lacticaseibacillus casei]|uniref:hypothetical protein n=1 Tax=Lacticaseibacillus casei TaxID=1582 RepID=UPI001C387EEF|nr:hypothetical protein [Lacticaseibacillus casei]MDG3062117.1 hypothetical protein [Lacticaseibacillus sp. BCRC 81376]QXG58142.1 hypothetical protein KTT66_07980 [Lacticaseibacillus casei]